jgi:hypothetical protein
MVRTTLGVLHALAVPRFAKKPSYCRAVLAKFFAKDFDGNSSVVGVLRAKDGGCSSFAHFALQRISGDRLSDEILTWHAANLTCVRGVSQANGVSHGRFVEGATDCHIGRRDFARKTKSPLLIRFGKNRPVA